MVKIASCIAIVTVHDNVNVDYECILYRVYPTVQIQEGILQFDGYWSKGSCDSEFVSSENLWCGELKPCTQRLDLISLVLFRFQFLGLLDKQGFRGILNLKVMLNC